MSGERSAFTAIEYFRSQQKKNYVLLTVHPGTILVNNKLDAQFFMYVYFYSLHVSGSHVPIIRRIIVSMRNLVYVTLKQVNSLKLQKLFLKMNSVAYR